LTTEERGRQHRQKGNEKGGDGKEKKIGWVRTNELVWGKGGGRKGEVCRGGSSRGEFEGSACSLREKRKTHSDRLGKGEPHELHFSKS